MVELVYHLHRLIRDHARPASSWAKAPALPRGHGRFLDAGLRSSDARPLTPQRWRCDLEEALPRDAVVFSDIGGHMLFNIHHLCIGAEQQFVLNLGFGSMGHGTVAPIGAALAEPQRPVFAIVGDGCFTMNGMELLTAAEYGVPVVWIVENNNMHGITWHGSQQVGRREPLDAVRYRRELDVSAIAMAMGVEAWLVDGPGQIQRCIYDALAHPGPALIEVLVDGDIVPPIGDRARSVAGFIRERAADDE